jgi:hypothetical protein
MCTSGTAGTSFRRLIDYYNTTSTTYYSVDKGITINNCIFGSTPRPYAEGVRVNASTNKIITNTYYTNDYDDNNDTGATGTSSIIGSLIPYSGASTSLYTDPVNGDFTIKDAAFAGKNTTGDPRWRP